MEQEEELGPCEKEEKGGQMARSVTVEQTGTGKTENWLLKTSANLVGGTNRRQAVRRRTVTSVQLIMVMYLLFWILICSSSWTVIQKIMTAKIRE